MAHVSTRVDVPVTIDQDKCIDGCTLCVDMCPLDSLSIHPESGKAYMHIDECWHCRPRGPLPHRRGDRQHPPPAALTHAAPLTGHAFVGTRPGCSRARPGTGG
jgi:Fe-S-cluster-containing dehydrogenase component